LYFVRYTGVIVSERTIVITHRDVEWHDAFLRFVPRVFPRISFRRWYEYGGWDERYSVFAITEGDRIIASASLTRMDLVLADSRVRGWQLGAVGTDPERRKLGLQKQVLSCLLEHTGPSDLVFLFANHHVIDFYPRFGFRLVRDCMFEIETVVEPRSQRLRVLELASAEDRALLQRVAAQAQPVTRDFGAENYGQLVLWYWCNFYPEGLRYEPEHDAIFVVEQGDDVLRVYDVLAAGQLDLSRYLPQLVTAPVHKLEFGFTPARFWPETVSRPDYTDSPLFVRGPHALPDRPFKFPMIAQT
jgi:predicted N-acetyltransferase YhbS